MKKKNLKFIGRNKKEFRGNFKSSYSIVASYYTWKLSIYIAMDCTIRGSLVSTAWHDFELWVRGTTTGYRG
jgi:hypothetical protein